MNLPSRCARAKLVVLIRHAECEKNLSGMIGGSGPSDHLTAIGRQGAERLGSALRASAREHGPFELLLANSDRARLTGACISRSGALPTELKSISMGAAEGLTEIELRERYPETFADLKMYRAGVLNSYDIRLPPGAEDQHAFESKTVAQLEHGVKHSDADWVVFVLHRSPITTVCIHASRVSSSYPSEFFGRVEVDPTGAYLLAYKDGAFKIMRPNVAPSRLRQEISEVLQELDRSS